MLYFKYFGVQVVFVDIVGFVKGRNEGTCYLRKKGNSTESRFSSLSDCYSSGHQKEKHLAQSGPAFRTWKMPLLSDMCIIEEEEHR